MRKNVSGQSIAAQLAALTDGAPVTTGTTTVYITIDNGTQASAGTATHKGQGQWMFAPSAANVNGNHIAFTFVHTLAVAVTLNAYPVSYDPTNATTLGLTNLDAAVSGVAADVWTEAPAGTPLEDFAIAVRDVDNTAPAADSLGEAINEGGGGGGVDPWTTVLPGAYGAGSAGKIVGDNLNATVGSRGTQTSVDAIKVDTAAVKLKTDNLPASPAAVGSAMVLSSTGLDAIPMTLTAAPSNFREWMVWLTLRFRRVRRVKATGVISVYGSDSTTVITNQASTDSATEQTTGVTT